MNRIKATDLETVLVIGNRGSLHESSLADGIVGLETVLVIGNRGSMVLLYREVDLVYLETVLVIGNRGSLEIFIILSLESIWKRCW